MADYYLVPGSAKMHILTNGKGSIASNSTAVISSGITLNVGTSFSTTSNIASYGAYYTNGSTAMQIPNGNTANRPTTAGPGYMRYNTDKDVIEYYRGAIATWLPLYSPPQLNSIDISLNPSTYIPRNQAGTVYLNLRGYNFENTQTPLVFFYGLDGSTNFISPSVTWVSYNRVIAVVPSSVYTGTEQFIATVSPYSVRITSSISGMSQTLVNVLPVGVDPVFNESQTNPLTLTYFNSRSYRAGTFNAGQTGVGIGNYISAFDASAQPILFSIDGSNNSQYAPYNLDLSWNPTPVPDANGNYYAYFITKTSQTIPNNAVTTPTIITLGVVATNTITGASTKAAFKITINPYYLQLTPTYNSGSGQVAPSATTVGNTVYYRFYSSTTNTSYNTYPTTLNYTLSFIAGCPGTTADPSNNNLVDFLLVGGGGGGGMGYQGGGGGAGGLISSGAYGNSGGGSTSGVGGFTVGTGNYPLVVGGGGAGAIFRYSAAPNTVFPYNTPFTTPSYYPSNGANTTLFGYTSYGGGFGGGEQNYANCSVGSPGGDAHTQTVPPTLTGFPNNSTPGFDYNSTSGGCGGGGSHGQFNYGGVTTYQVVVSNYQIDNGGSGTANQGYGGGYGYTDGVNNIYNGAGGGGAGGAGGNAVNTTPGIAGSTGGPGTGGLGLANSITGSSVIYACGGGGSFRNAYTYTTTGQGSGGSAGINGGNGNSAGTGTLGGLGTNGSNGTGTGGGASGGAGSVGNFGQEGQTGCGGNGVAIIRFPKVVGIT